MGIGGAQSLRQSAECVLRGVGNGAVDRSDDRGVGNPAVGFDERSGADEPGGEPDDEDIDDSGGGGAADGVNTLTEVRVHIVLDPRADAASGEGEEDTQDKRHRSQQHDHAGVVHDIGAGAQGFDEWGEQAPEDPADD